MDNITLDICKSKYWEFIRDLRNDKRVLDGFINSTYITKKCKKII